VIFEREYGPDHVQVAITLTNLGNAYGSLGDYGKKKELLERVLVIKERKNDPDHVEVARTLNSIGWAAWEFSDSLFGEPLLSKGVAILRSHHPDSDDLSALLDTHGCLLHDLGRPDEARPLFKEALKLVPSTDLDSKLSYLTHLSDCLISLNTDLPLARAHLEEALTLSTTSQDPKASLEPHLVLARLCLATDAKEDAKTHLEKAQPICDKHFPKNHRFHKDLANLKAKL
jgi:tetratricopeptide (TPR) repeat protein